MMADMVGAGEPGAPRSAIDGRIFEQRDGVWTDIAHRGDARVVGVVRFSSAWFDLVRALPEIENVLRTHESVVIAGQELSLEVSADGVESLGSTELAEVVAGFRGPDGR
jgi:hypothetical protein